MAERTPPDDASRSSQPFRGPFSEPRSQRLAARQYPASLDTDLSLAAELRRSEEQAEQRSLPNNLVRITVYLFLHWLLFISLSENKLEELHVTNGVTVSSHNLKSLWNVTPIVFTSQHITYFFKSCTM